jgi:hypothetical protein
MGQAQRICVRRNAFERFSANALQSLGGLNVPQIVRVFRMLPYQTGWPFSLNATGYTRAMEYLVGQFAAALRCMAETQRGREAAN